MNSYRKEREQFRKAFCNRWVIHTCEFSGLEDENLNGEDFENCIFEVQMAWLGWLARSTI